MNSSSCQASEGLAGRELPQNLPVYWHPYSGGGGHFTHASDGAEFHRLDDAVRHACELMEQAMRENTAEAIRHEILSRLRGGSRCPVR